MTDSDVIAAIRKHHLKANIADLPADADQHWSRAWVDPGGSIWGEGPYVKLPVSYCGDEYVIRVYAPARLRRRLAARWEQGRANG